MKVALLSHKRIRQAFSTQGRETKRSLAEVLAKQLAQEPKRRAKIGEDSQMSTPEVSELFWFPSGLCNNPGAGLKTFKSLNL